MIGKILFTFGLFAALGLALVVGSVTAADQAAETAPPAGQAEMKLPPGWTEADMQACILAATPGKMHEHLAKGVGIWQGKTTMWMAPGADPIESDSTSNVTTMMDGRYTKCEMVGEMPGMGRYSGFGIYGFDNVSEKFVCIWLDNHSTGIMQGMGELSADGTTTTWKFTFNCPVTKKPAVMREIETITGPNSKTLEMFGTDPKSGKEYKMMNIELTKES